MILGGTGFIGPHEINYAKARGHKVTMFNRGKTAPDMFPQVEALIGDRNGQLDALKGRDWDAVIDNSGFYPRHARLSAELLEGHVKNYLFVSSISAYSDDLAVDDDEFSAPLAAVMDDPADESEPPYGPTYGSRKALCEQEVTKVFGDRAIIVRPGIITGTGDPTERFRHWLRRMYAGNEILVPGEKDLPIQYIDAADMSGWMVRMLESGGSGPYNAVGAQTPYRAEPLLKGLIDATGSRSTLTWVDWDWLRSQLTEVPGYAPWYGTGPIPFMQVNNDRALAAGLTFRPIGETARDMIAEFADLAAPDPWQGGLDPATEAAVLETWHKTGNPQ